MEKSNWVTINVDLVTPYQRISGAIVTRSRLMSELLNDNTTSIIELSKAFVSRLAQPGEIVSYTSAPIFVRKSSILFAVLATPEKPITERNVYNLFRMLQYQATLHVRNFELTGTIESIGKIEFPTLMAHGDSFVAVNRARAAFVGSPVIFEGEQILANKAHIDLISAVKLE
jgi:hypothetical protein